MELAFDSHDRAFQAEVRSFIDRHWPASACGPVASVAALRQRFERLAQLAADIPDGDRSVADGADFQRRYCELEVELLGIEMLALRSLADGEAARAAPVGPSILQALVELKSAAIGQHIAQLAVETLGYYALPFPEALLIDNEGPIGHDYALSAMQAWLSSGHGGRDAHRKDAIARSALDL